MLNWEMQERGWYTSQVGGILEDAPGKWFFWELKSGPPQKLGPWPTLKAAKEGVERWLEQHPRS